MSTTPDNLADELCRIWGQLDPIDDWRPVLDKAAAELRRLAAVEAERDELRQLHERTIIEGGKKLGEDLSDEPRAKWLLLGVGRVVAERDQLRAEVEALRADAERYRWLRNEAWGCGNKSGPHLVEFKPGYVPSRFTDLAEEAADAAVDAARKR